MDGQQLDGAHPQVLQIADDGRAAQSSVGSAEFLGDLVVEVGEALDVQLIDHGVAPPGTKLAVALPVEVVGHHDRLGHRRGRVELGPLVESTTVPEQRRARLQLSTDRLRVRVEQQLGRVESPAVCGIPATVGTHAVQLADRHARDLPVPHAQGVLGELVPDLGTGVVEQADPHSGCLGGPHREVGRLG